LLALLSPLPLLLLLLPLLSLCEVVYVLLL
jgi:hypothetical protein